MRVKRTFFVPDRAAENSPPPFKRPKLEAQASVALPPVSSTLPFLKLPRELRDMIYTEVVVFEKPLGRWPPNLRTSCKCLQIFVHQRVNIRSKALAVLHVSRQVYNEAGAIFLLKNKFEFSMHELHNYMPLILKLLPLVRDVTFGSMRDPIFLAMDHLSACQATTYSRAPDKYYRSPSGTWTERYLAPLARALGPPNQLRNLTIILRADASAWYRAEGQGKGSDGNASAARTPWRTSSVLAPFEAVRGLRKLTITVGDPYALRPEEEDDFEMYIPQLQRMVQLKRMVEQEDEGDDVLEHGRVIKAKKTVKEPSKTAPPP